MFTIEELIPEGCVRLDVASTTVEEVVRELVSTLETSGTIKDADALVGEVLEREALTPTAVGAGCAIPHARSDAMNETVIAVGRASTSIDFPTPDDVPVRLVFLLAGPKNTPALHLQVLSKLARFLHAETFRQEMIDATDEESVRGLLRGQES